MIQMTLVNIFVVSICVLTHYEALYRITLAIPKISLRHRYRIVFGVFGALIAHAIEIWIFAIAYYFMDKADGWGTLRGNVTEDRLMDCVYFSFTVFTTLGFGDIEASGRLRHMTGVESLTGLVLITWTASFLYFEMQRHWGKKT